MCSSGLRSCQFLIKVFFFFFSVLRQVLRSRVPREETISMIIRVLDAWKPHTTIRPQGFFFFFFPSIFVVWICRKICPGPVKELSSKRCTP